MGNINFNGNENRVGNLWPGAIIPYEISSDFPSNVPGDNRREAILTAIQNINNQTNFNLVPRTNHHDYVQFIESIEPCNSNVGRIGGKQIIRCDLNGVFNGTLAEMAGHMMHELGHAIGLQHEHQRPDRDNYITINLNDVNHKIVGNNHGNYDFRSNMHYFFDANRVYKQGLPSDMKERDVGRLHVLSQGDIAAINYIASECLKNFVAVNVSGRLHAYDDDRPWGPDKNQSVFSNDYIVQRGKPFKLPRRRVCADEVGAVANPRRLIVQEDGSLYFEGGWVYLYEDVKNSCGAGDLDGQSRIPSCTLTASNPAQTSRARADNEEIASIDHAEIIYHLDRRVDIGGLLANGQRVLLASEVEDLENAKEELASA